MMKKLFFVLAALCAMLFTACISISTSNVKSNGQTTIKGLLQTNGECYFIAISEYSSFYFVKDENDPNVWAFLSENVGKHVTVEGYVVKQYDDGSSDVAIREVHRWKEP